MVHRKVSNQIVMDIILINLFRQIQSMKMTIGIFHNRIKKIHNKINETI